MSLLWASRQAFTIGQERDLRVVRVRDAEEARRNEIDLLLLDDVEVVHEGVSKLRALWPRTAR